MKIRLGDRITRTVALWAKSAGYTILPTWKVANWGLAGLLRELLKQYQVDCIIDVGANDGGYARFLRLEAGYNGLILSFEPVAALAAACREAAANDPNWHVFGLALGDAEYETEISVASYSQLTSLLPTVASPPPAMMGLMAIDYRETVEVRRLDMILSDLRRTHGFKKPYLKVDTQGFDLAVLKGAGDFLETMVAVQTELSFRPLYQGSPGWRTTLDFLEACRFSVSNMFAINADASLRAIEFDCVMVNDRFATRA
jgi:FkbM family methyltransferase